MEAVFRCRHQSAEAIIAWRVNESSIGEFPDITAASINESGTIVYTLTIPARSKYNETVVECVAAFINGFPTELTPPVRLTFLAGSFNCVHPIVPNLITFHKIFFR